MNIQHHFCGLVYAADVIPTVIIYLVIITPSVNNGLN